MNKKLYKLIIDGEVDKFYSSREWRRKRKDILIRDNKECQHCKEEGKVNKGETVHHINHLRDAPHQALDDGNLILLCFDCHEKEHPEKLNNNIIKKFENEERWE